MAKRTQYDGPCPIERVINVFGGKWKPAIVYFLVEKGTLRFSELRKLIPEVTQRMLTQQLRELERDGLVKREQFLEIPPRVEYTATAIALSLTPVFQAIDKWGEKTWTRSIVLENGTTQRRNNSFANLRRRETLTQVVP